MYLVHENSVRMCISRNFMHLDNKKHYFVFTASLSTFSYSFRPRGESATFLFATMLPNEDFGNRNSRSGVSFRGTLRWLLAQIEYWHPRKVPRKDTPDMLFRFPKSSLGGIKVHIAPYHRIGRCARLVLWFFLAKSLCLPNEDFWKTEQHVGRMFSRYFAMVRSPNRVLTPSKST